MSDSETEWFADEEFWKATYDFMFTDARLAAAPSEVEQIIALTGCKEGWVLDLASGVGRHSVAFARRGFRVTGVDRSPFFLDRATANGLDAGVDVECGFAQVRVYGNFAGVAYDVDATRLVVVGRVASEPK